MLLNYRAESTALIPDHIPQTVTTPQGMEPPRSVLQNFLPSASHSTWPILGNCQTFAESTR